jgi:enoyl-CoA hydratase/carnithine racemase
VVSGEAAEEPVLLTERGDGVGWLTLNRPAKRNALNRALREALDQSLAEFAADDGVRVVVLTGAGTAFCAGADLSDGSPSTGHPMSEPGRPVAQPLAAFTKPLIAAINGPAFGGGLELALACDLRVAARGATFALPEVKIGSLPGSGGTQRLVRAIGPAVAARMLFSGEPLSAADALRTGLISDLVEVGELADFTGRLARKISVNAPLSLLAAKQCLTAAGQAQLSAGLELERALWTLLATTEDRREGRAAFREHRAPRFTGN